MKATSTASVHLFFAHQSVGADVLAGAAELAKERAVPDIQELSAPQAPRLPGPLVSHARLGNNGDPQSKLDAFAHWIDAGMGERADYVMLKFCYVDITTETCADTLMEAYENVMAGIRAKHAQLRLAHCTIPLRRLPSGAYATLRQLLGHRHAEVSRNQAREKFNDYLRSHTHGEPLFDLARAQSAHERKRVPGLRAEFTSDGGHLNATGRRIVATAFLTFFDALELT